MNSLDNTQLPNMLFQPGWYNPIDKFFRNEFMGMWSGNIPETLPALNIRNRQEGMYIEVAIPGLTREELNLVVRGNSLHISSDKKTTTPDDPAHENFFRREFNYSTFSRTIPLPEHTDSDKITARYINGILEVNVPKKIDTRQTKSKVIKIE